VSLQSYDEPGKRFRTFIYLQEEVRTEHNFGEIVGQSAALRKVLKEVETVAPTNSTVLIRAFQPTFAPVRSTPQLQR
jgi:transcriptional regulator with PAS, ATPase and Fis domain